MIHQLLGLTAVHLIHGISSNVESHKKLFLDCICDFPTWQQSSEMLPKKSPSLHLQLSFLAKAH